MPSKFLPTTDDWYPNWPRGTVKCSLLDLRDKAVRVCVWGADDCGMERDYPHDEGDAACYLYLNLPNPVTKQWLTEHGFQRA